MAVSDFINIGNPRKIITILDGILDQANLDLIEAEIRRNTSQLFDLAITHYRFANSLNRSQWRQKVSRLYYAGYSASKAIRYFSTGHHSTEGADHKKVGDLPGDFPRKNFFTNKLTVLRDARNTCDYDHTSKANSLIISTKESSEVVTEFLKESKGYLSGRGVIIRWKL